MGRILPEPAILGILGIRQKWLTVTVNAIENSNFTDGSTGIGDGRGTIVYHFARQQGSIRLQR